jgi:hypothetical protein
VRESDIAAWRKAARGARTPVIDMWEQNGCGSRSAPDLQPLARTCRRMTFAPPLRRDCALHPAEAEGQSWTSFGYKREAVTRPSHEALDISHQQHFTGEPLPSYGPYMTGLFSTEERQCRPIPHRLLCDKHREAQSYGW